MIPGALATGDLCDVAAALAPRPLRLEGLVDGQNRLLSADALRETYATAHEAYRLVKRDRRLVLDSKAVSGKEVARWLQQQLQGNE
jgi:hypothetical protein